MADIEAIIARARACVGARFRLQGRDPAIGLDCVGLAAEAFGKSVPPARYALRGGDSAELMAMIAAAGMRSIKSNAARAGDLLMVQAAPCQLHLLVLTGSGFIHADARLRRVVEVPGLPAWPVLHAWRMDEETD